VGVDVDDGLLALKVDDEKSLCFYVVFGSTVALRSLRTLG
jgi:hypothetical protein